MNLDDSSTGTPSEPWRRIARIELRRGRRYLLSLTRDLSEEELEWYGAGERLGCIKWHAGHLALRERELLGALVPALSDCRSRTHPCFGGQARTGLGVEHGPWSAILEELIASRRLSEALLATLPAQHELAETFLGIVNHEYEHARFLRRLRLELGRPDAAEPAGRLVALDTDVEEPPLFFVPAFDRPSLPGASRSPGAAVVSLQGHRQQRAAREMGRGQELVSLGDYQGALEAFDASQGWQASADALTYQGWMHSLLGDNERAEELCLEAIDVDPDFGNPYNDIGTFCLRRRDVDAAIRWFEKAKQAARYEPRHFPYVNLGRLFLSLGQPERALSEFEGALEHDPGNREVELALNRIRSDLGRPRA